MTALNATRVGHDPGIHEMGNEAHADGVRHALGEDQERNGHEAADVDPEMVDQRLVERAAQGPAAP